MTPATDNAMIAIYPELADTRQFTSAEYHRLIDAGVLDTSDKVELLDGFVIYKADHVDLPTDGPFPQWRLLRRWTTNEYRRMVELGVIRPDERLELLDGYLVLKMPQNLPHRSAVSRLGTRLAPRLPPGWWLETQYPIAVGLTDPEPDGVILRGCDADYDARRPVAADFGIVIDVSDSTLALDRVGKGRLYARSGIPVYWIVNVIDRQIEVYSDPDSTATPPAYRSRTDYKPGDTVPITLDGAAAGKIAVSELLP
jgi:Uma2 family endonuclease